MAEKKESPKTVEQLTKELAEANEATLQANKAKEEAEKVAKQVKEEAEEALSKAKEEAEKVDSVFEEETVFPKKLVVHRKATWCTIIGKQKFFPGYNVFDEPEAIKEIMSSSAWTSETQANPLHNGRPNMTEVKVSEEAKASFADTIKAMSPEAAMELISHHGNIEDIRAVFQSEKGSERAPVKEAAKNQIEEIESRN